MEIKAILRQAGEIALSRRDTAQIYIKPDRTPFTDVELDIEALILPFLKDRFPDDQILSEEGGSQGPARAGCWVLDPIDGTKMFLTGLPTWGISLGSLMNGQSGVGFFYVPATEDLYWGGTGYGAFLNDQPLPTRSDRPLDDPLSFIAIPANAHRHFDFDFPHLRCFGSTAAHCCYVARGAAAGALLRKVNLWDIAGVLPILAQTGVRVEYFSGEAFSPEPYLSGGKIKEELLIARPELMQPIRDVIRRK
jgi:myo-inositol-1(or 4)-monophosphatase